ncbi:hypothetical protein BpHYR1_042814 [Brachionus plicatilis]|uniref:Uncharacterized protein n=1 Tax=Brachionus plicatilis TaxID=10195 RepID=A0A3M7Q3Z0_BRAPC|nr:hypothetical protein BpHYR1_042814 [Brachionus plicatilis]
MNHLTPEISQLIRNRPQKASNSNPHFSFLVFKHDHDHKKKFFFEECFFFIELANYVKKEKKDAI